MLIERILTPKVFHWLDKNKILIIKGSRQVGKTTLLKVIKEKLEKEDKKTFYLSIDQELDNPILSSNRHFITFIKNQFPTITKDYKLYLFLDEFQYLPNAGLFLKNIFDQVKETVQIIASGSSSLEITKSSEFLTGRKIEFQLYPLSYFEYVTYRSGLKLPADLSLKKMKQVKEFYEIYSEKINEPLNEYINFGGYPEIVITRPLQDKIEILKQFVQTYIEKDIIVFLGIENVGGFRSLLKILCDQIGNLANKSELSNTVNLSMDTLKKYLDILEGTFVIDFLKPFFRNIRKEISKMQKIFVNDFGIRNIILNQTAKTALISGPERENFVYNVLKEKYGKENLYFYRTVSKAEIDFIVQTGGNFMPIEVKSTRKKIPMPKVMEIFREKFKGHIGDFSLIITDDFLEKDKDVYYVPMALLPFLGG